MSDAVGVVAGRSGAAVAVIILSQPKGAARGAAVRPPPASPTRYDPVVESRVICGPPFGSDVAPLAQALVGGGAGVALGPCRVHLRALASPSFLRIPALLRCGPASRIEAPCRPPCGPSCRVTRSGPLRNQTNDEYIARPRRRWAVLPSKGGCSGRCDLHACGGVVVVKGLLPPGVAHGGGCQAIR